MSLIPATHTTETLTRRFAEPVINSVLDVFKYFVGTTVELVKVVEVHEAPRYEKSSAIEVNGPGKGIVVVNLPRDLVSKAVSLLIDESLADDEHVLTDFSCELSNMIAGQAKKAVDHMGFLLGHPSVIETEQIDTLYPPEAGSQCGIFNTGIGPIIVYFGFVGQLGDIIDYDQEDADKKRVMIIDPDEMNRALFEGLLHERYTVESAATVEEAFMDAAIHVPDLILLDIDGSEGSHAEAVKYIKESPFVCNVEVLVMTSNRSTTSIIQAFNHGASDYILKTDFTKQILVGKIERALGRTPVVKEAVTSAK
ncbi:response regulator [Gimesia fumaroli]|jgi:CheY-like chemotaxis protein|uniref:DNA-binding transcriptional activator KdpE n=1 Tax=Gimesia fumaroli TaxID=2527976 RepID=A0A518ICT9_9PLAN|nr:response regulator [Gimesia fumaroli]QDV50928.1 DNA-binding transcriptional activator KdpE [Gimesia fumaroli]